MLNRKRGFLNGKPLFLVGAIAPIVVKILFIAFLKPFDILGVPRNKKIAADSGNSYKLL